MSATRWSVALLALGLVSARPAGAQPVPEGEPRRDRPRPGPGPDEMFKVVDAYLLSHVQDALGLSEEKTAKVIPLVLKLQSDRRSFVERRMRSLGDLRKLLKSGSATEGQVAEQMKEIRALESDEPAKLRRDIEAIDQELTLVQQAKYRVLEEEVRRRIHELRDLARSKRRNGRGFDAPARPRGNKLEDPRP